MPDRDRGAVPLSRALARLREPLDAKAALGLWTTRDPAAWAGSVDVYRLLGDRLVKLGEPLLAFDVIAEGLAHFPEDLRLRQLHAFALARSGATERANALLEDLQGAGYDDEETLGLIGRTHKDLAARACSPAERARHLQLAFQAYGRAYEATRAPWPGINAATTAVVAGDRATAVALARELHDRLRQEALLPHASGDRYWRLATLGEAALVLGDAGEAADWYAQAAAAAGTRFGDLSSTRRNARLLLAHLGGDPTAVERALRIPSVVVFAGHMIDRPDRAVPRFPPALEGAVAEALRARIAAVGGRLGFASAACGSDILFLEAMTAAGGETHVVLPFCREDFVQDSVQVTTDPGWVVRYERALADAVDVTIASSQGLEGTINYEYANVLLLGLAQIRATQLETDVVPLAVWDGERGDGEGGTEATVAWWRALGRRVELIDLAELRARSLPAVVRPAAATAAPPSTEPSDARLVAMLFADAVHFSRLSDRQLPRFVRDFLGAVAELIESSPHRPVMTNTWGDGLFFVFETVAKAGRFALDLCDRIAAVDWTTRGLPASLDFRVALHAGPVYAVTDPITRRPNYLGVHVSRAARIEPVTPPGQVYGSEAFAAVAVAQGATGFRCDYVGQTALAKGYGTFPTYHVRRA